MVQGGLLPGMKMIHQKHFRLPALFIILSLLCSLAACGQAPVDASSTSESTAAAAPGTKAETEPSKQVTESSEYHDPTIGIIDDPTIPLVPQSGTVKAGNLIEGISAEAVEGKAADEVFTASQYSFAADLLRRSYAADKGNCLVSPLSVMLALSMTANGAADETLQQMLNVLGDGMSMDDLNAYLYAYVKSLPSSSRAKLAIANSIWLNDKENFSVRNDFLKKDVSWYQADVYKTPFTDATVKEINGWVSKHTDDMIQQIINQLNDEDRLLLLNAICFDAKWASPYLPNYSVHEQLFTRADDSTQTVSMMFSQEHEYYKGENYTGFAKDYDGYSYKFVAILPDQGTTLDQFLADLDGEGLSDILNAPIGTKVNAGLPKFSYEYSASLKDRLQEMGIVNAFVSDPFDPDFADFSLLSDTNPLYISDVIHKTFIDVEEGGTRAAAVTAVTVVEATAMPVEPPKQVILDRPFLYMIVDNESKLPIFIGTVNSID